MLGPSDTKLTIFIATYAAADAFYSTAPSLTRYVHQTTCPHLKGG